jgi:hypothetical protein
MKTLMLAMALLVGNLCESVAIGGTDGDFSNFSVPSPWVQSCKSLLEKELMRRFFNHTWVEVWDDGWHCVGAAEPDEKGLDHAWFIGEAARAIKGSDRNAIHAVTYRPRGPSSPWSGPDPPACPPRM